MNRLRPVRPTLALLALSMISGVALADDLAAAVAKIHAAVAPSIVSIRVVLKTQMDNDGAGQERDRTLDAVGAIVDPQGLILLWNAQLSSSRLAEMIQAVSGNNSFHFKITPTDFKVLIPGETTERHAFLAASDTALDLAFLQLEPRPAAPLPAIDFGRASTAARIGDPVISVGRLSSAFDRASYFEQGRIAGEIEKPRRAFIVEGGFSQIGLPLFGADGAPVGVLVTVISKSGDQNPAEAGFFPSTFLGGQGPARGPLGVFLLPADRVRDVVAEAAKRGRALLEEHAGSPAKEKGE